MRLDPALEGRLFTLELTFAVMLAGAEKQGPGFLQRMHTELSDRIRDAATGVAARHTDVPEFDRMTFVEAACDALDNLITTARALR